MSLKSYEGRDSAKGTHLPYNFDDHQQETGDCDSGPHLRVIQTLFKCLPVIRTLSKCCFPAHEKTYLHNRQGNDSFMEESHPGLFCQRRAADQHIVSMSPYLVLRDFLEDHQIL